MMRPVLNRDEYLSLRNGGEQRQLVERIRSGEEGLKHKLVQMNYSCLPNEDGSLKGSTRMSTTVGMDIDHLSKEEMPTVKERILAKKDELGLLMFEESARGAGYHLVFRRRPELSQEENLKWASELLEVEFDKGAKDITRVFFTTTEKELIYLDDEIYKQESAEILKQRIKTNFTNETNLKNISSNTKDNSRNSCNSSEFVVEKEYPQVYHGIPFKDIIAKYWELNNHGFEPTIGDRDTLTYQLACDLRHICGKNADWLDQVIPCYNGFSPPKRSAQKSKTP